MAAGSPSGSPGFPIGGPLLAIDTHAHVSMRDFDADREMVIDRCRVQGVHFIEIGFDAESSRASVRLAEKLGGKCAVGVHPHNAGNSMSEVEAQWASVRSLLKERPGVIAAVGEMGLDYARDFSPRPLQSACFQMGLDLAREVGLPAVIHQRDAHQDVLEMVKEAGLTTPVIFHCFSGDADYARKCVDLGGYLGFGGTVTYPKNQHLRDALTAIPKDRILLETDAPYLSPQTMRGRRNEPAFVLEAAALAAQLLGLGLPEFLAITSANSERAFLGRTSWMTS
ncbi:MAG: TatD family hydrolase [Bacillota bacterium]